VMLRDGVIRADGFKSDLTALIRGSIGVELHLNRSEWTNENRGVAVFTGAEHFRVETIEIRQLFFPRQYPRVVPGSESITLFCVTVQFLTDGPCSLPTSLLINNRRGVPIASLCAVPAAAFRCVDPARLVRSLRRTLLSKRIEAKLMPDDPSAFSFWLPATLPLSAAVRQQLLSMSLIERLRALLVTVSRMDDILCSHCKRRIGSMRNYLPLTSEGFMRAFVNPNGASHELLTISRLCVTPVRTGRPTSEHSWFRGYSWTIISCVDCLHHLGWMFTLDTEVNNTDDEDELAASAVDLDGDDDVVVDTPVADETTRLLDRNTNEIDDDDVEDDSDNTDEQRNVIGVPASIRPRVFWGLAQTGITLPSMMPRFDDSNLSQAGAI